MLFIHFIAVGKRNEQRLRQRLIRTSPPRLTWLQLHLMTRVDIRHTFASADTPPDTIPVLPDGWNAQDAAAHLEKRSWLLIRDDGPLSIRRAVSCTLWVLTLMNGWSWSPAGRNSVLG